MAKYTAFDISNATKFATANTNIRFIQAVHKKAPHLASWLEYKIRDATADDFYIPATLRHACKHVDIEIPEKLCSLLSCTPMKETRPCDPTETASYYYVGDNAHDVQCQPACYHTLPKATYTADGTRAPDMPILSYNKLQNKCRHVNSPAMIYLEKPFYRSETIYETRVNDMPTGFSRVDSTNPYGCGITYRNNEQYCKYYDRTILPSGDCDLTWWEQGVSVIIGMTFVNTVKSGIRMLTNDGLPFELPTNLPKLPETLETIHTLDGWRNNINTSFVVPDLIDTRPQRITPDDIFKHTDTTKYHENEKISQNIHMRRTAELNNNYISNFARQHIGLEPNDKISLRQRRSIDKDTSKNVVATAAADNINKIHTTSSIDDDLASKKAIPTLGDYHAEKMNSSKLHLSTNNIDDVRAANIFGNSLDKVKKTKDFAEISRTLWLKIKAILISVLKSFTQPETYVAILGNVAFTALLDSLKSLSLRLAEKLTSLLTISFLQTIGTVSEYVFGASLRTILITTVSQIVFNMASKVAIFMAKLIGAATSVIGWILVGAMVFDLIFAVWDPFGYNNMYASAMADDFMTSGEIALRESIQQASANFGFHEFVSKILDESEIIKLHLDSLLDTILYLDALVVNSEGSRIDKGDDVNFAQITPNDLLSARNEANATRVKFNNRTFYEYNEKFMTRVQMNRYINYVAGVSFAISIIFIIFHLNLLAFVFFILFVIILALSRMSLQNDLLVDVLYKYRNRTDPLANDIGYITT